MSDGRQFKFDLAKEVWLIQCSMDLAYVFSSGGRWPVGADRAWVGTALGAAAGTARIGGRTVVTSSASDQRFTYYVHCKK